jgi:hypothetical protein
LTVADDVAALLELACTVNAQTPPAFQSRAEVWQLVALLEAVIREDRGFIDTFPPDTRALFYNAARAPLAAFTSHQIQ